MKDFINNLDEGFIKGFESILEEGLRNVPPQERAKINRFKEQLFSVMKSDATAEQKKNRVNEIHEQFKQENGNINTH